MPAMHLQISGRVQGVGFRWFIRVAARRLDLAGWVRNMPDGSVEIAASGPQERLDEFRRAISRGPDGAMVTAVKPLEPIEELEYPFSVKR
jgi:acylphosphatase